MCALSDHFKIFPSLAFDIESKEHVKALGSFGIKLALLFRLAVSFSFTFTSQKVFTFGPKQVTCQKIRY